VCSSDLTVARFTPYKRVDLAVDACTELGRSLMVVGSAVGYGQSLHKQAARHGVRFLGPLSGERLRELYRGAKAFLMPAEEDFGITAVEAQACGTPVIAFGSGGARDTVIDKTTGLYFAEQTREALYEAIERFELMDFDKHTIRKHAENFSEEAFINKMRAAVSLFLSESSGLPFDLGEDD
jgi:glycosyltransferase involved in cell wall biosynthesis